MSNAVLFARLVEAEYQHDSEGDYQLNRKDCVDFPHECHSD